jgi:hypothetical protein
MNECHECVGNNMSRYADNGMSTPDVCDELCNDRGDDEWRRYKDDNRCLGCVCQQTQVQHQVDTTVVMGEEDQEGKEGNDAF